ncbi:DUF423 domain-containing protein [Swaminathania salitolerans]|uniref:DUF423 domain-containing protein n=1 Tax=Swaminathania salitolerans TaxID=182838 RepID=A0A511BRM4_9PROT|nr:DUF423 domain-containing protein [Swaminathania salitolerans]GEL02284.1 hypothetical protein SSA02_14470 [Swaminathania salitolerans]
MVIWQRLILGFCGLGGCSAVMLAALSAHLPETAFIAGGRAMLGRAVSMLIWHVLAMMIIAFAARPRFFWVALPMAAGTFLFVVPVSCLALKATHSAFLAPVGGTILMLAWLGLTVLALLPQRRSLAHRTSPTP